MLMILFLGIAVEPIGAEQPSKNALVTKKQASKTVKYDFDPHQLGKKLCPVMRPYGPTSQDFFYDYDGQRFYFCCHECVKYFAKNPTFFIQRINKEIATYQDAQNLENNIKLPKSDESPDQTSVHNDQVDTRND